MSSLFLEYQLRPVPKGRSEQCRLALEVPAGSLAEVLELSVVEVSDHPEGAIGAVYRFGPSGTAFDPPANVRVCPIRNPTM